MSDNRDVARTLLMEAGRTVLKDRPGIHGSAENSFQMIADFWTVHTRHLRKIRGHDNLQPEDVAEMMTMLKKARKVYGVSSNADNDVDDIGYAALAGMLRLPDPAKTADEKVDDAVSKAMESVGMQMHTGIDDRSPMQRAVDAAPLKPMLGDAEPAYGWREDGVPLTEAEYKAGAMSWPTSAGGVKVDA